MSVSKYPVFPDIVYTLWSTLQCLNDGLTLPDELHASLLHCISLCEPYFVDGFVMVFDDEE